MHSLGEQWENMSSNSIEIGALSDFSDDDEETGVEQLSGCQIPGCQCDGRIPFMEWGSEDMTETDDSEYEGSIDRENRLYMERYNYDLSEGMTPMTYNPLPPYGGTGAGGARFGGKSRWM